MNSREDFDYSLKMINPKVLNHLKVITKDDLTLPYTMHMAKFKQKEMVPNVSTKAASSENNTVPRVYTAESLIGCLAGYSLLYFESADWLDRSEDTKFKNFYHLHYIKFEYALKPNKRILFDAHISNEIWLITYNKKTITYPVFVHGEFYVNKLIVHNRGKTGGREFIGKVYEFVINAYFPIETLIDDKLTLKGYYEILVSQEDDIYKLTGHREIDKSEYNGIKKMVTVENEKLVW